MASLPSVIPRLAQRAEEPRRRSPVTQDTATGSGVLSASRAPAFSAWRKLRLVGRDGVEPSDNALRFDSFSPYQKPLKEILNGVASSRGIRFSFLILNS
jgi:hypothetical protein